MTNSPTMSRRATFEFTGTAWGYSKLWLVNLLLTVVTLGIYGAWAKVRNNQYLYGHTQVDQHRLQYLAQPMQILMGRLFALGVLLVLSALSTLFPMLNIALLIVMVFAFPWLIMQGMKFTYRNTAYRNVRFEFTGTYMGALLHFLVFPIIALLTLYLAAPWAMKRIHQYLFGSCEFGGRPITLNTSNKVYYKAALVFVLVVMAFAAIFLGSIASTAMGMAGSMEGLNPEDKAQAMAMAVSGIIVPIMLLTYFMGFLVQAIFNSMIRNHIVNNLSCEEVATFESNVTVKGYLVLMITNALLLLITLGLAFPATKARKIRYLSSCTTAILEPGIEHLANTVEATKGAIGEEAAGLFDADLSIV